jgi:hypothetical protein
VIPRAIAHGIPVLAGVGSLLTVPFAAKISVVLAAMLLLVAAAFELLVVHSRVGRRSRPVLKSLMSGGASPRRGPPARRQVDVEERIDLAEHEIRGSE